MKIIILIISLFFSVQTHPIKRHDFQELIEFMKQNKYLPPKNEEINITETEFFSMIKDLINIPISLQNLVNTLLNQDNSFNSNQCSVIISLNISIPCDSSIIIIG
jgi:predicted KAP-like P-loop ATPase